MVAVLSSEVYDQSVQGDRLRVSFRYTFDDGQERTLRSMYFPLLTDVNQILINREPEVLASYIRRLRHNEIRRRVRIAEAKFSELLQEKTLQGIDLVQQDFRNIGQRMNDVAQWIRDNG